MDLRGAQGPGMDQDTEPCSSALPRPSILICSLGSSCRQWPALSARPQAGHPQPRQMARPEQSVLSPLISCLPPGAHRAGHVLWLRKYLRAWVDLWRGHRP